jgi:O-acetyl-ADP-ribose deacetylase
VLTSFLGGRVRIEVGDITRITVDAIVNAANASLLGGGGVDGAIHRRGGPDILAACQEIRRTKFPQGLPTGAAVLTTAGRLPARYVIHTVGPIWGQHDEASGLLASCYRSSIELAQRHGCQSIAFPAISTGVYGYPKPDAARVSSESIREALVSGSISLVQLVFFSDSDADVFLAHQVFEQS